MNIVVMDTPGLLIAVSPLLPTDLIKGWYIIRPEYQKTLYFYNWKMTAAMLNFVTLFYTIHPIIPDFAHPAKWNENRQENFSPQKNGLSY